MKISLPARQLMRKVKYAAGVVLGLNSVTLVAALTGQISWAQAGVAACVTTLPVLVAYLVKEDSAVIDAQANAMLDEQARLERHFEGVQS